MKLLIHKLFIILSLFFISYQSYGYKEFDLNLIHREDFDHTLLDGISKTGFDIIRNLSPKEYYDRPITMKRINEGLMVAYGGIIKYYSIKGEKVKVIGKFKNPFFKSEFAESMQIEFHRNHWIIYGYGRFYKLKHKTIGKKEVEFTPIPKFNKKISGNYGSRLYVTKKNKVFLFDGSSEIHKINFDESFSKVSFSSYRTTSNNIHAIRKGNLSYLNPDKKGVGVFNFENETYDEFLFDKMTLVGEIDGLSRENLKQLDIKKGLLKDKHNNTFLLEVKNNKPHLIHIPKLKNLHHKFNSRKKFEKNFIWYKDLISHMSHRDHYIFAYDDQFKRFQILRKLTYQFTKDPNNSFFAEYYSESPKYLILLNSSSGLRIFKKILLAPSKKQQSWEDIMLR